MKKIANLLLAACLLSACDMITPPWKEAQLEQMGAQPMTCQEGKDCDEKWVRAKKWVKRKAKLTIVSQTDYLIKTSESPKFSAEVAFTVTKVPIGAAIYRIDYTAACDDNIGCSPPLIKLKASFVSYINGLSENIL